MFEEQWNKAAKGYGLGISLKASMQAGPSRSHREFLRLFSTAPERQASVMRFLCEQSILAFSSHEGGPP